MKRIAWIWAVWLLAVLPARAQDAYADSLRQVIARLPDDTLKVRTVNRLAQHLSNVNLGEAFQQVYQAQELAEALHFHSGLAQAIFIESVLAYHQGNLNRALRLVGEAHEINRLEDDRAGMADTYNFFGALYRVEGKPTLASKYFTLSAKCAADIRDDRALARAYNNMGAVSFETGNYEKALHQYIAALRVFERMQDESGMLHAYTNLGAVYDVQDRLEDARKYFGKAMALAVKTNDRRHIIMNHLNLADGYRRQSRLTDASPHYAHALQMAESLADQTLLMQAWGAMGQYHHWQSKFDSAAFFYRKAIRLAETLQHRQQIAMAYKGMGKLLFEEKKWAAARQHLEEALRIYQEVDALHELQDCYLYLAKISAQEKDFAQSTRYYGEFVAVQDSVTRRARHREVLELQAKYEHERKEQEILRLSSEKAHQEKELQQQLYLNYGTIFGLTVFVVLSVLLFLSNRGRKYSNILLAEQNQILALKNQEITQKTEKLLQAEEELRKVNEAILAVNSNLEAMVLERTAKLSAANDALKKANHELDLFIYRASHDLQGPITTLAGLVTVVALEPICDLSRDYFQRVEYIVRRMDKLLHRLMQVNVINRENVDTEPLDLSSLARDVRRKYQEEIERHDILCQWQVRQFGEAFRTDRALVLTILEILLDNAILFRSTHRHRPPEVEVLLESSADQLLIRVQDNGQGIPEQDKPRVFDMFFKGSEISRGNGLGLYVAARAAEKLGGMIQVESVWGEGSTFTLHIFAQPPLHDVG